MRFNVGVVSLALSISSSAFAAPSWLKIGEARVQANSPIWAVEIDETSIRIFPDLIALVGRSRAMRSEDVLVLNGVNRVIAFENAYEIKCGERKMGRITVIRHYADGSVSEIPGPALQASIDPVYPAGQIFAKMCHAGKPSPFAQSHGTFARGY